MNKYIGLALLATVAMILGCGSEPAKACDDCGKLPANIAPVPLPPGQTGQITTQSQTAIATVAPQAVTQTTMVPRTVLSTSMVPVTTMQPVTTAQTVMEPVTTTTLVAPAVTTFSTLGFNSLSSFNVLDVGACGSSCGRARLLGNGFIFGRRNSQTTTVKQSTTVSTRRGRR